jgi:AraC-like DNA-binding protein
MQDRREPQVSLQPFPQWKTLERECGDPRMRAALQHLIEHDLKRKFRTEGLGKLLNLSTSRVQHLFQQHFGISPTQVLKLRRIQTAKQMLQSTYLRVKEIMAAVGLEDPSHFVRDFKAICGVTPSEFRGLGGSAPDRSRKRPPKPEMHPSENDVSATHHGRNNTSSSRAG